MKILKSVLLLAVLVQFSSPVQSQSLSDQWKQVQSHFIAGRHDSVLVYIPAFIRNLENNKVTDKLPIANYHYAVSLVHCGYFAKGDSVFSKASEQAYQLNNNDKVSEISQKRITLYRMLAAEKRKSNPDVAIELLSRAMAGTQPDSSEQVKLLRERSELYELTGFNSSALTDIENALTMLPASEKGTDSEKKLKQNWLEIKFKLGSVHYSELAGIEPTPALAIHAFEFVNQTDKEKDFVLSDRLLCWTGRLFFTNKDLQPNLPVFLAQRFEVTKAVSGLVAAEDSLNAWLDFLFIQKMNQTLLTASANQLFKALLAAENPDYPWKMISKLEQAGLSPKAILKMKGDYGFVFNRTDLAFISYREWLSDDQKSSVERMEVLNNLAVVCLNTGKHDEAGLYLNQLELASKQAENNSFYYSSLVNQSILLTKTDQFQKATEVLNKAIETARLEKSPDLVASAMIRLSMVFELNDQPLLAGNWMKKAGLLADSLNDRDVKGEILLAIARQQKKTGNLDSAEVNYMAVLDNFNFTGNTSGLISLSGEIAELKADQDSLGQAIFWYRSAVNAAKKMGSSQMVAENAFKLANAFRMSFSVDSARFYINLGLAALTPVKTVDWVSLPPGSISDIKLFSTGLALLSLTQFGEARKQGDLPGIQRSRLFAERSLQLIEKIAESLDSDNSLTQRLIGNYRLMVDIYFELFQSTSDMAYLDLAWNTSEKARARQYIQDAGKHLLSRMNDPVLKKIHTLKLEEQIELGVSKPYLAASALKNQRGIKIKQSVQPAADADSEYKENQKLLNSLVADNNKASQLVTVNIMTRVSSVNYLAKGECILNYFISSEHLVLFALNETSTIATTIAISPDSLQSMVTRFRIAVQDTTSERYLELARQGYDLLISPVKQMIGGSKLVIIPSGPLHFLPFSALHDGTAFLGETNPITLLPNVSTLQFFSTKKSPLGQQQILALGNPKNPTVTSLPGAEVEVRSLKSIYPDSKIFTGLNASEHVFKTGGTGFSILHVACHGIYNTDYPYLSHLALSPDNTEDGKLFVTELYNLNLMNTRLVVLSACETGLSQIKKNDDMVGLVRGFIYAGVSSVVASLWKVDDFATYRLMTNFHTRYSKGYTSSSSLQVAVREMVKNQSTSHPYYWAAFSVYGRGN